MYIKRYNVRLCIKILRRYIYISYIIMNTVKSDKAGTGVSKDGSYYVYDTVDNTIDKCSGKDILLLAAAGRTFLNYRNNRWSSMDDCCIAHPKLGVALQNYNLCIAYHGVIREFLDVAIIAWIRIQGGKLIIDVVDSDDCTNIIEIDGVNCNIEDYGYGLVRCESSRKYKIGQAGAEILKRYV